LIQKSLRSDSIVAYFYSTASPRRLLQQNRHYSEVAPNASNGRFRLQSGLWQTTDGVNSPPITSTKAQAAQTGVSKV
jgi:hypothetical protein